MSRKFISVVSAFALVANSLVAVAQNPVPNKETSEKQAVVINREVNVITSGTPNENTFVFNRENSSGVLPQVNLGGGSFNISTAPSNFQMDMTPIKGKPYSAEVVNEHIQTLGDGNRISQKSSSFVARDSEGRTRRAAPMPMSGPLAEAMKYLEKLTMINDPVAGANYMLNPTEKTATKIPVLIFKTADGKSVSSSSTMLNETRVVVMNGSTTTKNTTLNAEPGVKFISSGELTSNVVNKSQPTYPSAAKNAGAQGAVLVRVVVNEKGDVVSEEAVSGHPLLKDAALDAAKLWKFKPTEINGQPVKVQGTLTFNFTLQGDPANPSPRKVASGVDTSSVVEKNLQTVIADGIQQDTKVIVRNLKTNWDVKKESLGKQTIEGVVCDGERTVTTIPAGEVGNDNPIRITSETWIATDLKVTVLRKFNDPRFGEDISRLTNISLAEPDKELFKVPADYKIIEESMPKMDNVEIINDGADGSHKMVIKMKKNVEEKQQQ
jgi:TonB family protein